MLLGGEAGDAILLDGGDGALWLRGLWLRGLWLSGLLLRGLWWLSVLEWAAVEVGLEDGRDGARRGREDGAVVDGRDLAGEDARALEEGTEVDLAGEGGAGSGGGGRIDRIVLHVDTPDRNAAGLIPTHTSHTIHRHHVTLAQTLVRLRTHVHTLRKRACEGVVLVLVHLTAYLCIEFDTTHWSGWWWSRLVEAVLLAQHEDVVNVVDLALGVDEQVLQSAGGGGGWLAACLDRGSAEEDSGFDVGCFAESDDLDGVDLATRPLALVGVVFDAAIDDGEVVCRRGW